MPRRSPGEGGYRKRTDGRYYAYRTVRGQRLVRYAKPNTEAGAKRALRDLNREIDRALAQGERLRTRGRTVAELAADYLADIRRSVAEGERSPNTLHTYQSVYASRIAPALGRRRAQDLRVAEVEDWLSTLPRSKRPYALTVLRAILTSAERREELPRNVARLARTAAPPPRRIPAPLTKASARRILALAQETRYEVAIVLALTAGLREAEITGLRWPNVDLDRGVLTVVEQRRAVPATARTGGRATAEQAPPKTKRDRLVALPAVALAALVRQRQRQREDRVRAGRAWTESGHVLTTRRGTPVSATSLRGTWSRLVRLHGLGDVRFHDLRHGWSSLAHAEGVGDETRAAALGHTRVQQTHDYTEVGEAALRAAAAAVERAIGEA